MEHFIPLFISLLICGSVSRAFNIKDVSKSIEVTNGIFGSQFGYSVALHENDDEKWLLVGAPKESLDNGTSVSKDGAIYKCPLDNRIRKRTVKCSKMNMNSSSKNGGSSVLFSTDFEELSLTKFQQVTEWDDFDWEMHIGPTTSDQTGPPYDHTTKNETIGTYMLLECSHPRTVGETAMIVTPLLPRSDAACVRFWYHMRGVHMGGLNVYLYTNATGSRMIWSKDQDQGNKWHEGWVTVIPMESYQILLEGLVGQDYNSDIGVDDVTVLEGACVEDNQPGEGSLGMTISSDKESGKLLACAPTWSYFCKEQYHVTGLCYLMEKNLSTDIEMLSPCRSLNCNDGKLDLVFLIDGSDSVNVLDFKKMMRWISNVVSSLSIGEDLTRVGIAQYSSTVRTEFHLNKHYNVEALRKAIKKISYMRGKTATGKGIKFVTEQMFTPENGMRSDTKHVIVVITDGKSQDDVVPPSQEAKGRGITLFAIGVGVAVVSELNNISSDPDEQFVYSVDTYKALDGIRGQFQKKLYALESQGSTFTTEQCQSGTSASFFGGQPVIGLPGLEGWSGGITVYPEENSMASKISLQEILDRKDDTGIHKFDSNMSYMFNSTSSKILQNNSTIQGNKTMQTTLRNSYLGYSIVTGSFHHASSIEIAIGAPRHKGNGAVFILSQGKSDDNKITAVAEIDGQQLGSYFGHALCMTDLNNDGIDELFIGAPLHIGKWENMGNVMVYTSDNRGADLYVARRKIVSLNGLSERNARFGFSIAAAGDLNGDGFGDIAIGAPSDAKGEGAIFIYNGRGDLTTMSTPTQVLKSSSATTKLVYFGYALHAGIDVDGNGYPDITTGAPGSDKALVMLSRPVINVQSTLISIPDVVNISAPSCYVQVTKSSQSLQPCSNIEICFDVSGTSIPNIILLEYSLKADVGYNEEKTRARFLVAKDEIGAIKNAITCINQTLAFREFIYDVFSDIVISMEYRLSNRVEYTEDSPVLNIFNTNPIVSEVKLAKECMNENCESDLKLTCSILNTQTYNNIQALVLDNDRIVSLDIKLENKEDDAYNTEIKVFYHRGLYLNHLLQDVKCMKVVEDSDTSYNSQNASDDQCIGCMNINADDVVVLILKYATPVMKIDTCEFKLQFGIRNQTAFYENDLAIHVEASSLNSDLNTEDNICNHAFPIHFVIRSFLTGKSDDPEVFFALPAMNEIPIGDVGPNVSHTYIVKNIGNFAIPSSFTEITWPRITKDGDDVLYLMEIKCNTPGKCICEDLGSIVNPYNLSEIYNPESSGMSSETIADIETMQSFSKYKNELWINCNEDSNFNCSNVTCLIKDLQPDEILEISLDFRIWKRTLDLMKAWRVHVSSNAKYFINNSLTNMTLSMKPNKQCFEVTVEAYNILGDPTPDNGESASIKLWLIIAAIAAGLLLLSILVCVLHKKKFFESKYKRKKEESLEWRDYQQYASAHEGRVHQKAEIDDEDDSYHQMATFQRTD